MDSRSFNKGYDNNYKYHHNTYYTKKKISKDIYKNKEYYKYKDYNYGPKKEYKTTEKGYDYSNFDKYDKKDDRYIGKKKYKYNDKRNTLSYSTRR